MRLRLLVALSLSFVLAGLPVPAGASGDGVLVEDFFVAVGEDVAHGLVARPVGTPDTLVVVAHGYGHVAESHRGHLQRVAELGAVGVAMDYRGGGFPLAAGAEDTIAATRSLLEAYPSVDRVILYSVSMGTAVAGIVLAELPDTFDFWVNNEGLSMLHETWAGAAAIAPVNGYAAQAKADIEAETGGTPLTHAGAYVERSAALRAAEFRGLRGAYVVHGVHDGLVPYDQGREMVSALRAAGIPSDFHTVLRGEPGGEGTTVTGYAGFQVDGLAGHGSESDDAHTLTAVSFGLLYDLVRGELPAPSDRELVVDRDLPASG